MHIIRNLVAAAALAAFAAPVAATTLVTPLNANNGNSGIFFDVVIGSTDITMQAMGIAVAPSSATYNVYTRVGSANFGANDASLWTLRGSFVDGGGTGSAPSTVEELITLDFADFVLNANTTYSFYLVGVPRAAVWYTNMTFGAVVAEDENLKILSGYGSNGNFSADNIGRAFNGSFTYAVGDTTGVIPEPATWAMLITGFGLVGAAARRRRIATTHA